MAESLLISHLPPEIHLLIATYLPFPDLIYLKITCTYFNALIPRLTHYDLLLAETTNHAKMKDLYACRYCLRLRPAIKFADRMLRRRRGRFGRDAWKRFCVECGLEPRANGETARYGPGAEIVVQGTRYVLCMRCGELGLKTDKYPGIGLGRLCMNCYR